MLNRVDSVATIAIEAQSLLAGLSSRDVVSVGDSNICFIKVAALDLTVIKPFEWTDKVLAVSKRSDDCIRRLRG